MTVSLRHLRALKPGPKVFFIGFNKCGTTSFHKFFKSNGYLSAHARVRVWPTLQRHRIPLIWAKNVEAGVDPLRGIGFYRVYSGISYVDETRVVEGNSYYQELHKAHPDAYFVLNTRPVEAWIRSRRRHRSEKLPALHAAARGISEASVEEAWASERESFEAKAKAYFAESPRFIVFDISKDSIKSLIQFFGPDFTLDERLWQHLNQTTAS